jgi:hypothetical protein
VDDMNERIQELAMLANIEFTYDPTEKPIRAFAECWEDELERFAELIVRECMELLSVNRDLAIEDGWNVDEAMSTAINDIEEHFGVEK